MSSVAKLEILKELFRASKTLTIFTLYKRVGMDIGIVVRELDSLEVDGIVEIDGENIRLTDRGRETIAIRGVTEPYSEEESNKSSAERFTRSEFKSDLYVPRTSLLDKKFFTIEK